MRKALLVNYRWCTGCHACELACQVENELPAGQYGIKLAEIGPWEYAPRKWQLDYIPLLTSQCHLCAKRLADGKLPSCVQTCQTNCLQVLDADEAAAIAAENSHMLMMTL